jgi:hypothetical protein
MIMERGRVLLLLAFSLVIFFQGVKNRSGSFKIDDRRKVEDEG